MAIIFPLDTSLLLTTAATQLRTGLGVLTGLGLLVLCTTSATALDEAKFSNIMHAADTLVQLMKSPSKEGRPPRQSDPAVKPLLDLVFDVSELKNGPVLPIGALNKLGAWLLAVNKVSEMYGLAGTGLANLASLPPNNPDLDRKINQNTIEFAPEMGRYFDAVAWLQGSIMDTTLAFLSTASKSEIDQSRAGVARIRASVTQTLYGVVTSLGVDGESDNWRDDRLVALRAIGPKAAKFLLPEDLRILSGHATEIAGQIRNIQTRDALSSFAVILSSR